ncbi:MAG: hypothetical protein LW817_01480 [Candidatus Caenarcaniphilales bacterium]|jgi:hypothetical protein|nr:hypothetical protein [Candidatus Caenarcaniphilales bacterium]
MVRVYRAIQSKKELGPIDLSSINRAKQLLEQNILKLPKKFLLSLEDFFKFIDSYIQGPKSKQSLKQQVFSAANIFLDPRDIPIAFRILKACNRGSGSCSDIQTLENKHFIQANCFQYGYQNPYYRTSQFEQDPKSFTHIELNSRAYTKKDQELVAFTNDILEHDFNYESVSEKRNFELRKNFFDTEYDFNEKFDLMTRPLNKLFETIFDANNPDNALLLRYLSINQDFPGQAKSFLDYFRWSMKTNVGAKLPTIIRQDSDLEIEAAFNVFKQIYPNIVSDMIASEIETQINVFPILNSMLDTLSVQMNKYQNSDSFKNLSFTKVIDLGNRIGVLSLGNNALLPISQDPEATMFDLDSIKRNNESDQFAFEHNLKFIPAYHNEKPRIKTPKYYSWYTLPKSYNRGFVLMSKSVVNSINDPKEFYAKHFKPYLVSPNSCDLAKNITASIAQASNPKDALGLNVVLFKEKPDNDGDDDFNGFFQGLPSDPGGRELPIPRSLLEKRSNQTKFDFAESLAV